MFTVRICILEYLVRPASAGPAFNQHGVGARAGQARSSARFPDRIARGDDGYQRKALSLVW